MSATQTLPPVAVIGAGLDLGAGRRGVDMGPSRRSEPRCGARLLALEPEGAKELRATRSRGRGLPYFLISTGVPASAWAKRRRRTVFGRRMQPFDTACSQAARQCASTSLPTTPKTVVAPFTLRTPKRWIAAPRGERYAVVGRSNRRSPCDLSRPERLRSGCAVPDDRLVRSGDAMRPAAAAGRRERGEQQ